MGLTNKVATKIRTAAKSTPINLPMPWDDSGNLATSAITRAAITTLSETGLRSSGIVGNDSFGIRSGRAAQASTLWYDQVNSRTWQLALGKPTVSGNVYDWQVQLTITFDMGGEVAEISTPAQLTRDGTLVNKAAHAELRDLLLTALASGHIPTGRAEHDVSAGSLPVDTLIPITQLAKDATTETVIRTSLDRVRLDRALDLVPFRRRDRPPGNRSWQLGPDAADTSAADQTTADARRTGSGLVIRTQLRPTGFDVADALVAERAYALPRSVLKVIQLFDTDARIDDSAGRPS